MHKPIRPQFVARVDLDQGAPVFGQPRVNVNPPRVKASTRVKGTLRRVDPRRARLSRHIRRLWRYAGDYLVDADVAANIRADIRRGKGLAPPKKRVRKVKPVSLETLRRTALQIAGEALAKQAKAPVDLTARRRAGASIGAAVKLAADNGLTED
jgi:hypothetical protein